MKYDQSVDLEEPHSANGPTRHLTVSLESHMLPFDYPQSIDSDNHAPIEVFKRSDVATAVAAFHSAFNLPSQTRPPTMWKEFLKSCESHCSKKKWAN